jgi:hypothetical protein
LTSVWRTQDITIDGIAAEWPEVTALDKGPAVAAANDSEFLYLTVSSKDQDVKPVLATGLILWFDAAGGRAQTFGIRMNGVEPPTPAGMTSAPSPSNSSGTSVSVLDAFDLLGPGKNQRRLIDVTPALGIQMASGIDQGTVIYELRVPLAASSARTFAIGAKPGALIGLGVATPDTPRERRKQPLVGSSGGYIGGNPYQAGANGGGFAPFPDQEERQKPLAIWTTLKLAAGK